MQFRFEDLGAYERWVELRARVRSFLEEERRQRRFAPRPNCWVHYDAEFTRRCGEHGFIGVTFPSEYGGRGASPLERYVIFEEMLAAGAPVGMHWTADRQSGPQIARHGSETAKRKILPAIATGRCCIGIGMSEANAGSDLAAVKTKAVKVSGGWRVNGTKLWTSNAHRANYVIVLVRTDEASSGRHEGLSQLIIDMEAAQISTSPIPDMTGSRDFNEVFFDDVFVSDEFVLGAPGDGWKLATGELVQERSGPERFMSTFVVFEELVRRVMSSPGDEATAAIGRLTTNFLALRRMSNGIAAMLDRGISPDVEAALVKDLGAEFERDVVETARRLIDSDPAIDSEDTYQKVLGEALLASPSFTLRGGTREILRGIVAKGVGLS